MHKNGGFPPIKYCTKSIDNKLPKGSKERLYANLPEQKINIRQLLTETQKKPIIITDNVEEEVLEEVDRL